MKLLKNFSNSKLHDTHGFKEEAKIKFNSVKTIAGRFPNGTSAMMILLAAETNRPRNTYVWFILKKT